MGLTKIARFRKNLLDSVDFVRHHCACEPSSSAPRGHALFDLGRLRCWRDSSFLGKPVGNTVIQFLPNRRKTLVGFVLWDG